VDSIRRSNPVLAADLHSFRRQRGGSFFNSFIIEKRSRRETFNNLFDSSSRV